MNETTPDEAMELAKILEDLQATVGLPPPKYGESLLSKALKPATDYLTLKKFAENMATTYMSTSQDVLAKVNALMKPGQAAEPNMSKYTGVPDVPPMQFKPTTGTHTSSDTDHTWKEPQITCPNCNSIINGLMDAQESNPPAHPTKFNQKLTAAATSDNVGAVEIKWRVWPCGCQVDAAWAGAYTAEVNNRKAGGVPKAVVAMSDAERAAKVTALEKSISNLMFLKTKYEGQNNQFAIGELGRVEQELVTKVDTLMRLVPGPHNKPLVPPMKLTQATLAWAAKKGLIIPPPVPVGVVPTAEEIKGVLGGLDAVKGWTPKIPQQKWGIDPVGDYGSIAGSGYMNKPVNPSKALSEGQHKALLAELLVKLNNHQSLLPALPTLPGHSNPGVSLQTKPKSQSEVTGTVALNNTAFQVEIDWEPNKDIPKLNDDVLDDAGNRIGMISAVSNVINTGNGTSKILISVVPVWTPNSDMLAAGEKALLPPASFPTASGMALEDVTEKQIIAKAVRVRENLLANIEKNESLLPETEEFLQQHGDEMKQRGFSWEVSGPGACQLKLETPKARGLRKLINRSRQKVTKNKKGSKAEDDE